MYIVQYKHIIIGMHRKSLDHFLIRSSTEACRAVGHITLMIQIRTIHMPPIKYTPDEIQKNMFLPTMKKFLIGGRHQNLSLFSYN